MNPNIVKFKEGVAKIAKLSERSDLVHRSGWGDINFEKAASDIQSIIHMSEDLLKLNIELLPDSVIEQGYHSVEEVIPHLNNLESFSITQSGDANQRRNELSDRIHHAVDNFSKSIGLWIPYLAYHRGDAEENIKKLNEVISSAERTSYEHLRTMEEKNAEAESLIERIKSTSAEAGVAVYTQDFDKESGENNSAAKKWLAATCIFGVATLITIIVFYCVELNAKTLLELLPKFGCRLLLVTTLFTAMVWCGRMYKALCNQAIINRHRALGLKTFRAFADAASDKQAKDAVLRETTHAIFSVSPTGLIVDGGGNDVDPNIVQIAGGVLGGMAEK